MPARAGELPADACALSCICGSLRGYVLQPQLVNRGLCYCRDCQAFARYLGNVGEVMNAQGGTDILQTMPARVVFTAGRDKLACMRLTEHGLIRWYASCCRTAVGNTAADYRKYFVGLIHTCLHAPGAALDVAYGPVRMHVNTQSALGTPKPRQVLAVRGIARLGHGMLRAWIQGTYRDTPFFDAASGRPVVDPIVLTAAQREQVRIPLA